MEARARLLSRTVLEPTTHPSVRQRRANLTETIDLCARTAQRVCGTFIQDLERQDVAPEAPGKGLRRVLK